MASIKGKMVDADNPLQVGSFTIADAADLVKLCTLGGTPSARGIVLANEKVSRIVVENPAKVGTFYYVTASVYLSRDAETDEEREECAKIAMATKARGKEKEATEQARRDREVKTIQQTAIDTARGIATMFAPQRA